MRSTPCVRAKRINVGPAITIDSLFTMTICLPASIPAMAGFNATSPTVAQTTKSTCGSATISSIEQAAHPFEARDALSASVPPKYTYCAPNSATWALKRS